MACAVIFRKNYYNSEVIDSKKLSAKKRNILEQILVNQAIEWKIGLATAKEIDYLNIRQATFLAMRRAISALKINPDYALVDGERLPDGICPSSGIITGDQNSFTISAASIIAKQRRDTLMIEINEMFPNYRFYMNKGYGTQEHIEAIIEIGESTFHLETFLKKLVGINSTPLAPNL